MDTDTTPTDSAPEQAVTPTAPEIPTTKEGLLAAMSAPTTPPSPTPESNTLETEISSQAESVTDNSTGTEGDEPASGATGEGQPAQPEAGADVAGDGGEGGGGDGEGDEQPEGKQPAKNFRGRWDHLDEAERRVVELTTKRGLTLAEAYQRVYGSESVQALARAGQQQEAPVDEAKPDPVVQIDEQLAAKQAEIDALEEAMDDDAFNDRDAKADRKKHRTLLLEMSELSAEKRLALRQKERDEAESATAETHRWQTSFDSASARAVEAYPDLQDPDSELVASLQEEVAYLQASNDPILGRADFPLLVARRVARQLGIRPAAAASQTEGATPPAATPNAPAAAPAAPKAGQQTLKARPVPAGGSPVAPPSLDQQFAAAKTPEQMLELMMEHGTPLASLAARR